MRVAIVQPSYLPWRGYFDLIDSVELFVVYDDVQFTRRDWRSRNRLKTPNGLCWLTVPVRHVSRSQRICDTEIDYSRDWQRQHLELIRRNLAGAPFLGDALRVVEAPLLAGHRTISELNVALMRSCCRYLGINTPLRLSSELNATGSKTERLIQVLTAVGATEYLSGPRARAYLDESLFRAAGITLRYVTYDYPPYPQLWGDFEPAVSIVDTIANCGSVAVAA
jgi:hypothetical protein